ncbi:MAG: thioredoxin domain-containing protein [Fimbriimonadaceae bacterium]
MSPAPSGQSPPSRPGALAGLPTQEEIAALPADGGGEFNRLIFETSPYLLQHARRPLDWYPWGQAAFDKAAAEDKPIFLSLGYATCHWCHVMEHESFNDGAVAEALNAGFVAIKVDREERPDVDHLYMTATQALTGSGGWPNTLLLTPDRRPFFAGTYIPKPQLLDLLEQARGLWAADREGLAARAAEIAESLVAHLTRPAPGSLSPETLKRAADNLVSNYDKACGGFGNAPKFPTPQRLTYLLRAGRRFGKVAYQRAAIETMQQMRVGGIYDQVGFGLHRYSTDRTWTTPHFEKMLYDQALAVMAYLEAYEATRDPFFCAVAEEILLYVDRDLSDEAGGFHSAEDADSEGIEGKFYVWTEAQLGEILGPELGARAKALFETSRDGNFHEPGLAPGSNVLRLSAAADIGSQELADVRRPLLVARAKRVRPLKDDKILCDWNGLMIAAFARAGAVLAAPKWTARAARAADFVQSTLRMADGALRHVHRLAKTQGAAGAQDYAFILWGLVELVQATGDAAYLRAASELADALIDGYWDAAGGGFFMAGAAAGDLFVRAKEIEEGAIPSGNGVAALALMRLAALTGAPRFQEYATRTLEAFGKDLNRSPEAFTTAILAFDLRDAPTVVLVGSPDSPEFALGLERLRRVYSPGATVLPLDAARLSEFAGVSEFLAGLGAIEGRPTCYVCRDFACSLPTTDILVAVAALGG